VAAYLRISHENDPRGCDVFNVRWARIFVYILKFMEKLVTLIIWHI